MRFTTRLLFRDQRCPEKPLSSLVVILGLICATSPLCPAEPYQPRVGQRHPDFVLPSIGDRMPVSLSQFRGKKVLLIQFASW